MNRCKASVGILLALIILCIFSLTELKSQCNAYLALADELQSAIMADDTEKALEAFDKLQQNWEQYHNTTGLFVNGAKLDSIREVLSKLQPMIEKNAPDAAFEVEKLRSLIQNIYEEEVPELWHIL